MPGPGPKVRRPPLSKKSIAGAPAAPNEPRFTTSVVVRLSSPWASLWSGSPLAPARPEGWHRRWGRVGGVGRHGDDGAGEAGDVTVAVPVVDGADGDRVALV